MMDNQQDGRPGGLSSQATEPRVLALLASIPDAVVDRLGEALALMDERLMTDNDRAAAIVELWEAEREAALPPALSPQAIAIIHALIAKLPAFNAHWSLDKICQWFAWFFELLAAAQAIEARRVEMQSGSVADESAVGNAETPTPLTPAPNND